VQALLLLSTCREQINPDAISYPALPIPSAWQTDASGV
jgi:hypothetical protein